MYSPLPLKKWIFFILYSCLTVWVYVYHVWARALGWQDCTFILLRLKYWAVTWVPGTELRWSLGSFPFTKPSCPVGDLIYAYMGIRTSAAGPCQQLVFWLANKKSAANSWVGGQRQNFEDSQRGNAEWESPGQKEGRGHRHESCGRQRTSHVRIRKSGPWDHFPRLGPA